MTITEQVEVVIERARRFVQADGGDIHLVALHGHSATVRLTGLCAGCPSAHTTLQLGVEAVLLDEIPELEAVHVTCGCSELTIPATLLPLSMQSVVIGTSPRMRSVFQFLRLIGQSDSTVLVTGETGTGKDVTATLLHNSGRRRHRPFIAVSCALFSETLIESELFGHERGAFTGAIRDRPGRFELAEGGTIFLDDIDDVPLPLQVKLLRVLQNRTIERLGGNRCVPVDVRIMAGTKRDLKHMVAEGKFREDLYYRLSVLEVTLPPLRARREDIPVLMDHFLGRYYRERGKEGPQVSVAVRQAFMRNSWPGNVRELENACEWMAQTCACGILRVGCMSPGVLFGAGAQFAEVPAAAASQPEAANISLDGSLRELEASMIKWALTMSEGNKSRAAALLHMKRSTLSARIDRGLSETGETAITSLRPVMRSKHA